MCPYKARAEFICLFAYMNFRLWLFGSCVGCVCVFTWEELKLEFSAERENAVHMMPKSV